LYSSIEVLGDARRRGELIAFVRALLQFPCSPILIIPFSQAGSWLRCRLSAKNLLRLR
jgi:hypothetical protein